jgi:hypothetical protein
VQQIGNGGHGGLFQFNAGLNGARLEQVLEWKNNVKF